MGMSAAQARLLSITARITDNELRSQMLTNSKLRLADKSSAASEEYMDALNSQQLIYTSYDGSGNKLTQALTPNTILTFADLKNQYAMVNSSGQILVSGTDMKNFEASPTMTDFMYCYGIGKVDNPKYEEALMDIYGKNTLNNGSYFYETLYDENIPYEWSTYLSGVSDNDINAIRNLLESKDSTTLTSTDAETISAMVNNWKGQVTTVENGILANYANIGGSFGAYVTELLTPPDEEFPDIEDYRTDEGTELANNFSLASKPCYVNAIDRNRDDCYIHVLAHLLDLESSDITDTYRSYPTVGSDWGDTYETSVGGKSITTSHNNLNGSAIQTAGLTNSMAPVSEFLCANDGKNVLAPAKGQPINENTSLVDLLLSNYTFDDDGNMVQKTFKQKIIDLFYVVGNNEIDTDLQRSDGTYYSYNDLKEYLKDFQNDMIETLNKVSDEYYDAVDNWKYSILSWLDRVEALQEAYIYDVSQIPVKELPDENDSKYQWYKNLWYRMGGIDEAHKDENGRHYKELDPNLLNSSEWLEFALEHGIVTLEQAQYNENGSTVYPHMGTYDWNSIIYTNASDIVSQEDSAAIARAEVDYENTLREIENDDKEAGSGLEKTGYRAQCFTN